MITNIKLKNFKVFKDEEFDLAPFTLITGINGMGKSSIIQSLLLLKQSHVIGYLETQGKVDLSNDFVNLETAENLCYAMASDNNRVVSIVIADQNGASYSWVIDAYDPKAKVLNCTYEGSKIENLNLFQQDFIFLDAERWGPRETYSKKEKRSYNTKLGIQGELTPAYLVEAISKNQQVSNEKLIHPNVEKSFGLYENLNAWMSDIMSFPLKTKVTEVDESKVKLSYNVEGSKGNSYSALQVGFGVTFCLPVVLAALQAKEGDLILIENPEAHLHPSAQVKIGKLLSIAASVGIQIIIESHSDHILNSVRYSYKEGILNDENLKILFIRSIKSNDINTPVTEYIDLVNNGKLSHRPTDFFDAWDKMLTKLI